MSQDTATPAGEAGDKHQADAQDRAEVSSRWVEIKCEWTWKGSEEATLTRLRLDGHDVPLPDSSDESCPTKGNRTGRGKIWASFETRESINYNLFSRLEFPGRTLQGLGFTAALEGNEKRELQKASKEDGAWRAMGSLP